MARPKGWTPYRTTDGTEVPSVTTILAKFRDPNPLMYWAWTQGKDGQDFRESRDRAASAGTLAHAMVEAYIRKSSLDPLVETADQEIAAKAIQAFENFREWAVQTRLTPIAPETRLVSERYRYGGTLDSMLIGGRLAIGDLKTSGAVYVEHLIQLAAYGLLWEENHPDEPLTGGFHILRISRDTGDFAHHFFSDLSGAAEAFLLMRSLWDLVKKLETRVR